MPRKRNKPPVPYPAPHGYYWRWLRERGWFIFRVDTTEALDRWRYNKAKLSYRARAEQELCGREIDLDLDDPRDILDEKLFS